MAFRNRIVRLSQLIADTITGAVIQTAATGARIILSSPGAFSNVIQFWSGNASQTIAGKLQSFAGGAGADNGVTMQLVSGAASNDGGVTSSPQAFVDLVSDATLPDAWVDLGPRVNIIPSGVPFGNGDLSVAGTTTTGALAAGSGSVAGELDVSGPLKIGSPGLGGLINEVAFAATATNTNAGGQVTINHGMSRTPKVVLCHNVGAGGTSHLCAVTGITSTQFVVTVRNVAAAGATVNSTAVDLRWVAIA